MKITIGADVWNIPDYCFKGSNATELVFDCEYQYFGIGTYAFSDTEIETVRIPEKAIKNIRSVGYRAFYDCPLKTYISAEI